MTSAGPWTSVSMPYVTARPSDAWGAEAAEHGGKGTQKLLSVDEVEASAMIADVLSLAAREPVVVRRRLMLFNEHPVELVDSYYPATIARDTALAEHRKIRGGAVAFLAELGYPPRHVREDISARLATPEEQTALQLDGPSCVLLLSRTLMTNNQLPVEASVMTMVADGRRLRYELTP
ncbi:UTRA domain-containing protein [Kibdelosporangium philippinense]|uniref:UTRA domain-containing protein n=1 Tax=Kibdelosporangium philippinense TaxID=211113 RepID=A0ABS8Z8X3_9PSEU|nr:UTRA domain-containing protein [Kibdelosporangium philippinense]MCE7004328.1 UTRA domain-containing protein [Kibdelosporangium philippinense]